MARLQILELPEGSGDDRPPFVLVVDEMPADEAAFEALRRDLNDGDLAKRIGAQGVLCFETTIDIPANEVPVDPDGYPLKIRVEPDFETLREQVQDEIRNVQADVTRAVREASQLPDSRESTGRPTHPDGTPYNYSEIVAGGWEHCDGCRTWGQWTPDNPHECPNTYIKGPFATERSPRSRACPPT
jgi:hypothetical protein